MNDYNHSNKVKCYFFLIFRLISISVGALHLWCWWMCSQMNLHESLLLRKLSCLLYSEILWTPSHEGTNFIVDFTGIQWLFCFFSYLPQVSLDLTPQAFSDKVLNGKEHWVIDFYAPWCGPCQNFAPEFEILAKVNFYGFPASENICSIEFAWCRPQIISQPGYLAF